jgi:hypothetical protein
VDDSEDEHEVDEELGMARRSPGALWSGVLLMSLGGANVLVGFFGWLSRGCDLECSSMIPIEVAAPMMIGGAAMIVVGIPLTVYGKKLVRERSGATLHVGTGGAQLVWRF